jgi:hypothetical protein
MNETVNSLWIGETLSPLQIISINSFLKNGYHYNLYIYDEIDNIPEGVNILDGNDILDESEIFVYTTGFNKGSPSAFSNLFRYKLLYDHGGLWADTDMVLLKDFEIKDNFIFISEFDIDHNIKITTGIMYSKYAGIEVFKECIEEIYRIDKRNIQHGDMGPILFDYKVKELDLEKYVLPPEKFSFPNWDETYKFIDGSEINKESIGIHLWNARWKTDGLYPYKEYDKNCIFEKLKERYL